MPAEKGISPTLGAFSFSPLQKPGYFGIVKTAELIGEYPYEAEVTPLQKNAPLESKGAIREDRQVSLQYFA